MLDWRACDVCQIAGAQKMGVNQASLPLTLASPCRLPLTGYLLYASYLIFVQPGAAADGLDSIRRQGVPQVAAGIDEGVVVGINAVAAGMVF